MKKKWLKLKLREAEALIAQHEESASREVRIRRARDEKIRELERSVEAERRTKERFRAERDAALQDVEAIRAQVRSQPPEAPGVAVSLPDALKAQGEALAGDPFKVTPTYEELHTALRETTAAASREYARAEEAERERNVLRGRVEELVEKKNLLNEQTKRLMDDCAAAEKGRASAEACYAAVLKTNEELRGRLAPLERLSPLQAQQVAPTLLEKIVGASQKRLVQDTGLVPEKCNHGLPAYSFMHPAKNPSTLRWRGRECFACEPDGYAVPEREEESAT